MRTDYGYEFPGRDDVRDTVKNTLSSAVSSVGDIQTQNSASARVLMAGYTFPPNAVRLEWSHRRRHYLVMALAETKK